MLEHEPAPTTSVRPRSLAWTLVPAAAILIAFFALAVRAHQVAYFPLDVRIAHAVQGMNAPGFGALLGFLSLIGFPPLVGLIDGAIILTMYLSRRRWEAIAAGFAALGAAGLHFLVQVLVERPRPPTSLVHVAHHIDGSGFPAGHVTTFTAFFGFLSYLLWRRRASSPLRGALAVTLMVAIPLMGVARIDAGEHWPSDVVGGYLLGALWLLATIQFYRRGRRPRRSPDTSIDSAAATA